MQQKYICLLCLFIAVFMLADGVFTYKKSNHVAFSEAQEKYKPLCNYNIIWGDLMPSGSEYVCQNNAFKFAAGSKNARRMAVEFLYRMGYSQVFLINDIPLPLHEITNELNSYRLPFKTDTLNNFGIVVYLTPQQISKP